MKKIIVVLVLMVMFMTGCSLASNTPSDRVREFLDRYKNNDTVVINELNEYLDSENYDQDTKDKYREVYLRQYTNLNYDIKDETINGDEAVVEVQVTVFDYYKTNTLSGDYFIANQTEFYFLDCWNSSGSLIRWMISSHIRIAVCSIHF